MSVEMKCREEKRSRDKRPGNDTNPNLKIGESARGDGLIAAYNSG